MAKVRIYELARELGVDNKVIIDKAVELGIPGKLSHSNSLDTDQSDQVRRAIIRQAIGTEPETKVVTTRVDNSTGEARTVVESRKGNIIRRRRRSSAVAEEEERPAQDEVAESAASEETATAETSVLGEEQALEDAEQKAEVEEVKTAQVTEDGASEKAVHDPEEEQAVGQSGSEEVSHEASEAQEAKEQDSVEKEVEEEDENKPGPKVLGRIELPVKKAKPAKKRKSTQAGFDPNQIMPEVEDDDDRGIGRSRKGRKKRGKKREFSRTDLVDYEGQASRRPRGAKGGRGAKGMPEDLEEDVVQATAITTPKESKRIIRMGETITVGEFAHQMSLKASEVIAKLIELGVMATINQVIDQDTVGIIAEEFGYHIESTGFDETTVLDEEEEVDDPAKLKGRPPVVTVMGHVDHGKTSLLDSIRSASVVSKEHGGITQHIGAYSVTLSDERIVTFIDTPGHAAFTSMRARGANVTDIVILVVAADDGVMPQTIEAINHAKAAEVTIVVAVNKMDKVGANPDRVKQQLAEHGLQPEDWGGDTMFFPVSAIKGEGITELLEGILLVAELKELKANPDRRAKGTVVEARQEKGRGTVATILVEAGTLNVGDIFVSGSEYGRVRALVNHLGEKMEKAGPSIPVEITGWSAVPMAGDDFVVVESETKARQVASHRAEIRKRQEQAALAGGPISLEEFAQRTKTDMAMELNLVVKADVHGSLEAVRDAVEKLSGEKVIVNVIHGGVGGVNESDVQLALASKAIIVGFNVRAEPRAMSEAERQGVDVRFYRVIYELIDEVRSAMAGLLAPIKKEVHLGRAEVRDTFSVPKIGVVAGCYIVDGMVKRGAFVRLVRDSQVVHEGRMLNLRRFKDDVKEVQSGYECGISIDGYNDIKLGDIIEVFETKEEAATLE